MDIRELDRRAVESTGAVIDTLDRDQLDALTPCEQWTVRDVIGHMVTNNRRFLATVAGRAGEPLPEPADDPRAEFRETTRQLAEAVADDEALDRPYAIRDRTMTAGIALGIHFADVLVHGWDIARATGTDFTLDQGLADSALALVSRWPDSPDVWGPGGAFAERLPVAADAPAAERLLAVTGRSSAWSPA